MTWNIAPECTSLLFLFAIIAYSRSRLTTSNLRDGMFRLAEWVALAAISTNIASTLMIYSYQSLPIWATVGVTTAYFVLTPVMPLIYFYYAVIMLHYNDDAHRLKPRWYFFLLPYAAYLILLISNFWTHTVFCIEPGVGYVQGTHIYSTYIVFYFYCFSVCLLAFQARRRIGRRVMRVMMVFPLVALMFVMTQKFLKDVILTGTASVFSLLVLFLYFQNNRLSRDGLTGLFNREALLGTVRRHVRHGEGFELLAVSLDNFKSVNLRFGTNIGDTFLREVGEYLLTLGEGQGAYRYSGDVFALLTAPEEAARRMSAIQERLTQPFSVSGIECRLSASMALVRFPESDSDPISALDYVLSELKLAGGGKVLQYEHKLISQKKRRRIIADALRDALNDDGFYLCYQPIWSISRQRFTSAEALLRMRETSIGPVYPDEFIPIAASTGLIVPITYMVLEKACALCADFGDRLESISVNFPFVQFLEPELEQRVMGILDKAGVRPERIKIEITERVLIEENEQVNKFIHNMSARGMRFCLDDFGIGYSNVEVMLRMPLDVIKLDRSLLLAGMNSPSHAAFFEKMVAGFTDMGRSVVAEGVETEEQLELVRECGCDLIQGYYFARPMPEAELETFLAAGR